MKNHINIYLDKLRRDMTPEKLYIYEFKRALFDNSDLEEFLLFIRNFNMTLEVSGTLLDGAKIQYLHTVVCREALLQLDTFSAEAGSTNPEYLMSIIICLDTYFPPVNVCLKKSVMHFWKRKPCGLKEKWYADRLINLNNYLDVFPGAKASDFFCVT